MILFNRDPDPIFVDVVDEAIARTVEAYLNFADPRDQQDWLCAAMPRSARLFTASQAKDQLRSLQRAHRDARTYRITRYHWLLLYECLQTFCQDFSEQPWGPLLERHGIRRLNLDRVVKEFFGGRDFLQAESAMMVREQTRSMLIIPDTLGVSAGFMPHPNELALVVQSLPDRRGREAPLLRVSENGEYPDR